MLEKNKDVFDEMDLRSQRKESFFFLIDFLGREIFLFNGDKISKKTDFLINFPNLKNYQEQEKPSGKINLEAFPQSLEEYQQKFDSLQDELKKGNSYLANLTCKTPITSSHNLEDIFHAANSKYKMLWKNNFCFFSPEPFIQIKKGIISTHPMKGTIEASIPNAKEVLKNNEKEKAEHFTVVDLLRNDLSQVANDVQVKEFQKIEHIKTESKDLFAMSSDIEGKVKPEFDQKIGSILHKLLPAGSILGAPKDKTLSILKKIEGYKRGFYTGVSGYFDGENLDSCVMIRFIQKEKEQLYFKSGGGITHQSDAKSEYHEMINKIYVPIH